MDNLENENEDHIIFYGNGRGGGAVSLDGGVTVIVATGRRLNLADTPVWKNADPEEIEPLLSEAQGAALAAYRERPPLSPLEKMAEDLSRRSALRQRQERGPGRPAYWGKLPDSARVVVSGDD